jgi:hypothetical protein
VPQTVVDGLEPVEIEQQDADRPGLSPGNGQRLLHPVLEQGTVGEPGE